MPPRRRKRIVKKRSDKLIAIFVIGVIALFAIKNIPTGYTHWTETPLLEESEIITFEIESGDRGKTVAENLETAELISNDLLFYWYLRSNELGSSIQAGRYRLSSSMTPIEIAEAITQGGATGEIVITIPEGWEIKDIDDFLYNQGLIEDDDFLNCAQTCDFSDWWFMENASSLEGYLFPDTYFVDPTSFDSESFIHRQLQTFETKVLTEENLAAIEASGRTLDEHVIMASIVEFEALWDEDRPIIAGIFWKRDDNDWGLGSDATLLYVLDSVDELDYNLDLDSPYNTRKYRGLPPTAINNPGLDSFDGAIYPEDTSYWFFLADLETGKAHYAATNDEHNENKAIWLY